MEWKKPIKLLYPPVWIIALLVPLCTVCLVFIFMNGYEEHPLAYAAYVISFYTLTAIVMRCITVVPKRYRTAKEKVYSNPVGNRYMTDMKFRTHVSLYSSLGINILYVIVNAVSGFTIRFLQ